MAFKIAVVICLSLALLMAQTPPVQAQLVSNIFNLVEVSLTVLRNTVTGLPVPNTTSPVFSGALVQVRVGTTPLAVGITDNTGSVNITLSPTMLLTSATDLANSLVNNGTIRILNPVLNQSTGFLTAPLVLLGNINRGAIVTIIRLGPGGFTLNI